jgi:hypothetical protein
MMATTSTVPQSAAPAAGRGYLWGGLFLAVLAIALCVVQFMALRRLVVPWHLPALTTLGAVLLLVALTRRRSVTRIVAFVLIVALAAFEWHFLLNLTTLPGYTGPAQTGQPLPAFQTRLADGSSFSDSDLRDGVPTVMVFFRGRW